MIRPPSFPSSMQPMVNPDTGTATPPWLQMFNLLWKRQSAMTPNLAASYANDAAAKAGGVEVGAFYRTGSQLNVRVT